MMTDSLVCGVNDENIQLKLLAEKDTLTFKNAMKLALAMKNSKNAKDLGAGITGTNASANAVKQNSSTTKEKCCSCGASHFRQS